MVTIKLIRAVFITNMTTLFKQWSLLFLFPILAVLSPDKMMASGLPWKWGLSETSLFLLLSPPGIIKQTWHENQWVHICITWEFAIAYSTSDYLLSNLDYIKLAFLFWNINKSKHFYGRHGPKQAMIDIIIKHVKFI